MPRRTYQYPAETTIVGSFTTTPASNARVDGWQALSPERTRRRQPQQPDALTLPLFGVPHSPPTPTTAAGRGRPVVARQPSREDATRQKRAMDRLADVFNSLGTKGQLIQDKTHGWVMLPKVFQEARNPGTSDDITFGAWPGVTWINTTAQTVWTCVSNAAGAAVWKQTG